MNRVEIFRATNSFDLEETINLESFDASRMCTENVDELRAMLDEKFGDFSMYNQTKEFSDMRHIPRYNIFEQVVSSEEIDKIKDIMHTNGAKETLMSGSGPAVFGEFLNPITAFLAKNALVKQGFYAVKCRMI